MSKRAVIGLLWFAAMWVGYEIVWSVSGVPRAIGPVVAAAVAGFVTLDPMRLFHAVSERRPSTTMPTSSSMTAER